MTIRRESFHKREVFGFWCFFCVQKLKTLPGKNDIFLQKKINAQIRIRIIFHSSIKFLLKMHKKHKPCIQGLTKNGFIVIDDRMILSLKKKSKSYHGELLVRRDYVLRHAYVFLYGLQRDTKIFRENCFVERRRSDVWTRNPDN